MRQYITNFDHTHPLWDWAWEMAITGPDLAQVSKRSGETWQFMGAWKTYGPASPEGFDVLEFRHRDLDGARVNLRLECCLAKRKAYKVYTSRTTYKSEDIIDARRRKAVNHETP